MLLPLARSAIRVGLPLALVLTLRGGPETRGPAGGLKERAEQFVLVQDGAPDEIGLAEWRRRRADGGWQLELDVTFPGSGIRVFAVECLSARGPRLVWREVSPGAGRTVIAEWTRAGTELRTLEWGIDGSVRESCDASNGAVMPLYLAELIRLGRLGRGAQLVFDPLGRGLERLSVRTSYASFERGAGFERIVELARDDGTLAARYVFHGEALTRFQWQEGGWRARRIEPSEYARRLRAALAAPRARSD